MAHVKMVIMRRFLITVMTFAVLSAPASVAQGAFGGLQLLDGYSTKQGSAVDALTWTIQGKGGLKIVFEAGPSEGSWASPADRSHYAWYREQTIRAIRVRFALVKA